MSSVSIGKKKKKKISPYLKVREDLKIVDHQFCTQFDRSVESY